MSYKVLKYHPKIILNAKFYLNRTIGKFSKAGSKFRWEGAEFRGEGISDKKDLDVVSSYCCGIFILTKLSKNNIYVEN